MTPLPRTQEEIAARVHQIKDRDTLGFGREVLLGSLDFQHARPFLKPEATAAEWDPESDLTVEAVRAESDKYLAFAFDKALDHRGLSAGRSVEKLTQWAWLLGKDELVVTMEGAYANYGMPALLAFAKEFDLPIPDDPAVQRMGRGLPCEPDCEEGCG